MQKLLASLVIASTLFAGCEKTSPGDRPKPSRKTTYLPEHKVLTKHFVINSSADSAVTDEVAAAVEALHIAYVAKFAAKDAAGPFHMILYKDRSEFKQNNLGPSWAEALYRRPYSYGYPAEGRNRYHWMLHEATHQLMTEGDNFRLRRWINEGTATYFGSSRLKDGKLIVGEPDPAAYPIWWLSHVVKLSNGDVTFADDAPISLRDILEESDASVSMSVNHRYIAYWSLVHYLIEGDSGKHYQDFKLLLERGGSPEAFRELIGPFPEIEKRWKQHLWSLKDKVSGP